MWIYCWWLFFVAKNRKNSPNPLTKKGKMGRIKQIRKFFRERRGYDYGSADFGCVGGAFGAFVGSGAGLCSFAGGGQRLPDPGALAECAGYGIPGGWCDVDRSVAENTVKEALEETGLTVEAERLIAVQDWRRHNACNYIYGIIKIFVLCRAIGGEFAQNIETTETAYFSAEELPEQLAVEKTSREQALMCLDAAAGRLPGVLFD